MQTTPNVFSRLVNKCTGACKKSFPSGAVQERGYWSGRFDFLLSSIGYVIGLGNVWGFPPMCYENGGSAFLIPYLIMVIFAGVPIIFMEMAFGQYTNMGPVHGWKACPIMTGIGWGMCFISGSASVYYNVLIAWSFYYMFASLTSKLPWSDCKNAWNDQLCLENRHDSKFALSGQGPCVSTRDAFNCTKYETPTVQYFQRVVLGQVSYSGVHRKMNEPLGSLQWHITLCLLLSWIVVFLCLIRGIKTSGKVVHFTALLPILILLVLVARGVSLTGAMGGLTSFLTPDFSKLTESSVWTSATSQAFFSLGAGMGGIATLASYNQPDNNFYRDVLIVGTLDTLTSIICSVAVFSVLGYMSHRTGKPVQKVALSGSGLAFVVYTEAVASMPGGPVWSFLFFAMLITLGIDTQFIMLEIVITAIQDQWPQLRDNIKADIGSKAVVCTAMFLLGLPMCCQGGIYVFQIFSTYTTKYNLYVIALGEIIGVMCFYGMENLISDINTMLGFKPGFYWKACWTVICPALLVFNLIFSIATYKPPKDDAGNLPMSNWGESVGWCIMLMSLFIVAAFAVTWRPTMAARQRSDQLENRMLRAIARMQARSVQSKRRNATTQRPLDGTDAGTVRY